MVILILELLFESLRIDVICDGRLCTGCVFCHFARVCCCVPYCCYRLHSIAALQALPCFAAYLECLQSPNWPIPGFSRWWSNRVKEFLRVSSCCFFYLLLTRVTQEIQADDFWTFHQPVAADTVGCGVAQRLPDARCIERTICEGRELLITTEAIE